MNPAQFAPHEDLATYPRTLPHDLEVLKSLKYVAQEGAASRSPSALFLPSVDDMYPSGITQDKSEQRGTFVEVKGYSHQMEGSRRPDFFRGVATVVTKLFNIIEVKSFFIFRKFKACGASVPYPLLQGGHDHGMPLLLAVIYSKLTLCS